MAREQAKDDQGTLLDADGRRQRGIDNRRKSRSAFLELVHEGVVSPTAQDVAHRAGVGLRSVFRYFPVMEDLYSELATHVGEMARDALLKPCGAADWKGRIAEVATQRALLYDRIQPFHRSIEAHRYEYPRLDQHQMRFAEFQREALLGELGDFLPRDKKLLATLNLMLSFDAWMHLRREQGLSRKNALAVVLSACEELIAGS